MNVKMNKLNSEDIAYFILFVAAAIGLIIAFR